MNKVCGTIQNKIFFKESITTDENLHINNCKDCLESYSENKYFFKSMKSNDDISVNPYFAENVMNKIYQEQIEASKKINFKDYFLSNPFFKYGLFSFLFIFPVFLGTF